ncbi:MAG: HD domain protein [bacterium ADurb.Bin212]|nr:MAG: HD domain protein [bacterium ADurb.Bin212]
MDLNTSVIKKAKAYQKQIIKNYGHDPYNLLSHFDEMELWADKLLKMFPEAKRDVVLLSVWLHDSGHYLGNPEEDHAVKSESIANDFLKELIDKNTRKRVCAAIRCHRCKDVQPVSIEEKIVACIDSVSHMTGPMYLDIAKEGRIEYCMGKIDRDYRDAGLIPEIQKQIEPIYHSWKTLISEYSKLNLVTKK